PDGALFGPVEGGGVVLVGDDHVAGVVGGVDLLGLSLVELNGLFHWYVPPVSIMFSFFSDAGGAGLSAPGRLRSPGRRPEPSGRPAAASPPASGPGPRPPPPGSGWKARRH